MSYEDIQRIQVDHIVNSPEYRFVCVNIGGRTRNLRIYSSGKVESYEQGQFIQLPSELAKDVHCALRRTQNIPTFTLRAA